MPEKINFVTTNAYKFKMAQKFFSALPNKDFELVQYDIETPEIQSESEQEIARQSAIWVSRQLGERAISSDVGFHIDSLGGFPGPFVKYANKWLQPNDILHIMRPYADRSAHFIDVLVLASPDGASRAFTSKTPGVIIEAENIPDIKWTMDALFVPEGYSKTLAEMNDDEQDTVWNNGAWDALIGQLLVDGGRNESK